MSDFSELFTLCSQPSADGAWTDFVETFGDSIRITIRRALWERGHAHQDADVLDLEQEVYCRLLRRAARGTPLAGDNAYCARAYFARVVAAAIIDRDRRRASDKRRCAGLTSLGTMALDGHESPEANPEERLLIVERVDWVMAHCRAVAGARNRRVKLCALLLVVLGGYTSRETVTALAGGITTSHVDALVSRLRSRMAAAGFALPRRPGVRGDGARGDVGSRYAGGRQCHLARAA